MPFYRVYYPTNLLSESSKATVASQITEQHCAVAGAAPSAVKVLFISFNPADAFSEGKPAAPFVRVVGVIRGGRDGPTRAKLLTALHGVFARALQSDAVAEITLVENRPEDNVRYAHSDAGHDDLEWAALAPPSTSS
ncbi:hypothetical protein BKA62DRAFT_773840 [Auriculariales sp. MPI-PUGE-AT-0066]|nr:hypothetical protein BKA62DRAFT_773840 [Auriculariales sp. MPI-PUGE-AT-0066]